MTLDMLHAKSVEMTTAALLELGILKTKELRYDSYRRFFPHSIGHYLGMDTHDVASIGRHIPFVPGMVVTVEPGLYIPDDPDIPQEFRGIGIRIEDDVLVTQGESEILTKLAPKTPDHIESLILQ
jgi:Xaa-Pro aminopeptidase